MYPSKSSDSSMRFVLVASLMAMATGVVLAGTAEAASEERGQFRAACVKVDITPDTPQWLQGYGPRQSTAVHDRIYHRIAVLDDGTTTFCLVSTDICRRSRARKAPKRSSTRTDCCIWSPIRTTSRRNSRMDRG